MRKILPLFLLIFTFISCREPSDNVNTFPLIDYSMLVHSDGYRIDTSVDALTVFNLFYDKYGYGEFTINGTAKHSESALLINILHTEEISCSIKKVKIYHTSDEGLPSGSFYVDFYNESGEILSYCYQWQYNHSNVWKNGKASEWCKNDEWYKKVMKKLEMTGIFL